MLSRFRDERGAALVTSMLVAMVVLSAGLVVIQLAQHNSSQSSLDRKRVQSVHAAEAGLDATLAVMQASATESLPCSATATLTGSPSAQYSVTIAYYAVYPPSGTPMTCPLSVSSQPAGAVLTATGTAVAVGATGAVDRTMQTQVRMNPIYGEFGQAIFSNTGLDLENNLQVNGDVGNDGNVYTNGNWGCENNSVISGSVLAQGNVTMGNGCNVVTDVWAGGSVSLANSAAVGHDLTASAGSITMQNFSHVTHNARAATTCTGCADRVSGQVFTNSPSPAPPNLAFPPITYSQTAWQGIGFTNFPAYTDCAAARSAINAGWSAKTVVRITAACALSWTNNSTIAVQNDLAIITNGSITTTQQVNFTGIGGTRNLYMIVPSDAGACSPPTGVRDISFSNLTVFNSVKTFTYSPCAVTFNNNNNGVGGQIFGGTVTISNLFTLNFSPLHIGAAGAITGYAADIAFIREIQNP